MTTETPAIAPPPTTAPRGRWFAVLTWLYALAVLGCWLSLRYAGDRFWPATVLLFAPRWPMALPLILLAPMAIFIRRRSLWVLSAVALLIAWPIMGFKIARLPRTPGSSRSDLRVLTLNTHFIAMNAFAMRDLINLERPDVIALQEWYGGNAKTLIGSNPDYPYFLSTAIAFVASRYPVHLLWQSKANVMPDDGIYYSYQIDYPAHPITFYNVHLASPHGSLTETLHGEKYGVNRLRNNAAARWNEAMRLHDLAAEAGGNVLVAGDFNLPPDSPIFRHAFDDLSDAFSAAGLGYGWTYRNNRTDLRIDHILSGSAWTCQSAWVGPFVGSPHRPLLADYRFTMP